MNKKGFTLTELLVVVVILGIIAGLSIPLIRNLSNMFEKKKYENYADSVLAAGKIFNDSYNEDLFGHNEYGCAYITYDKLVERKLIKDIEIDEMTCDSPKTYIRVIKQKDKYAYKTFLTCGTKREDGTMKKVLIKMPKQIPEMDPDSCTGVNSGNLSAAFKLYNQNQGAPVQLTMIFNIFVLYTLFNQLNCRVVDGSKNIFARIKNNPLFIFIEIFEFVVQFIIIEYWNVVFKATKNGLTCHQWLICILLSTLTLVLDYILKL